MASWWRQPPNLSWTWQLAWSETCGPACSRNPCCFGTWPRLLLAPETSKFSAWLQTVLATLHGKFLVWSNVSESSKPRGPIAWTWREGSQKLCTNAVAYCWGARSTKEPQTAASSLCLGATHAPRSQTHLCQARRSHPTACQRFPRCEAATVILLYLIITGSVKKNIYWKTGLILIRYN